MRDSRSNSRVPAGSENLATSEPSPVIAEAALPGSCHIRALAKMEAIAKANDLSCALWNGTGILPVGPAGVSPAITISQPQARCPVSPQPT